MKRPRITRRARVAVFVQSRTAVRLPGLCALYVAYADTARRCQIPRHVLFLPNA